MNKISVAALVTALFVLPVSASALVTCRDTISGCTLEQNLVLISTGSSIGLGNAEILEVLKQTVQQLMAKLAAMQQASTPAAKDQVCPALTRSLVRGSIDEPINGPEYFKGQVTNLQQFLKRYFALNDPTFVDGIYGFETMKYVEKFQAAHGIDQTGTVGPKTRAQILRLCTDSALGTTRVYTLSEQFPQTITLFPGDTYVQAGSVAQGSFRIEYVNKNTDSVRITGRSISGISSHIYTLTVGRSVVSENWPTALKLTPSQVNQDGSLVLTVDIVSTD